MAIYAALCIPEVWRYKGKKLRVHVLGEDGAYHEAQFSSIFPYVDMAKMNEFLQSAGTVDETTLLRKFAAWVRSEVLPLARGQPRNGKKPGKSV
jgi:hypothetical protein